MRLEEFEQLKEQDILNKDIHATNLADIIIKGVTQIKETYKTIPNYVEENMVFRRKRRRIKRDYFYEDVKPTRDTECEGDGSKHIKDEK